MSESFALPERRLVVVIADKSARLVVLGAERLAEQGWDVRGLVGVDAAGIHRELSSYAGTGLIVVDARPSHGRRQWRTFRKMFFHLAADDLWVAVRSHSERRSKPGLLARQISARTDREPWRSVERIETTPGYVAVQKSRAHLLKVRDRGATALLNSREPDLRVSDVVSLPAGTLTHTAPITDYGAVPDVAFPQVLPYPEATLRSYDGRVFLPGASVAIHHRSVLPDSFRWHQATNPVNRGVRNLNAHFANPKPRRPAEHLAGSYYFFGYNNPGHFGHLMTEALAKIWGWDAARADDPDVKLLCREHPLRPGTADKRLEHVLLPAYGMRSEDIVWATGPVTVDRMYGVTPLWHNAPPYYAHPAVRDDWRRLREGLATAEVVPTPKIFVSRPPRGNRACRNARAVEDIFARHGFAIVRPERLAVPEQAALFNQARVVAGFGGSGLFNLLYSESVETLIVLNQASYQARNEHLFAALLDLDTHVFWSPPIPGHLKGSQAAHQSAWRFDFDLNGPALETLLRQV